MRDKSLTRLGLIRPEDLDLEFEGVHNNVGTWKLALATEHPLTHALRQPGSGLIVTTPRDVLFSGPTIKPEASTTPDDRCGSVTFEGVTDTVVLADMLAWPQPSNPNVTTQDTAQDTRVGPAETLMHAFVNANAGPGAPEPRRHPRLVMGANLGRGPSSTKSARFPVLGELLSELAGPARLGFWVVQRGDRLVFETSAMIDRTATVRLDASNGTLAGQRVATSAPGVTRVIVAGQGKGTDRQFLAADTADSRAAEAAWGRRIERFVDQRQSADPKEHQQAADELLAEEGFTAVTVQAIPPEDSGNGMGFGTDWFLGDLVTVVIENQETVATVTGVIVKASSDGFRVGAVLGDTTGFDASAALARRVSAIEGRVSKLERNTAAPPDGPDDTGWIETGLVAAANWVTTNTRYRIIDGRLVEILGRLTYAGPTVTPPPNGNVTDIPVMTVPPLINPSRGARVGHGLINGASATFEIANNQIRLSAVAGQAAVLGNGNSGSFSFSYLI
ncbi:siphovirus ReqiPepy6 Gp37-like family protein [Kribbella deserti]|uniref:Siphovirus ReqiPepy6 Gp37-like family protein n=1 Tax=Kribbella deserti TaxID=1926257 RepID=A0ABV6QE26_9ACTN